MHAQGKLGCSVGLDEALQFAKGGAPILRAGCCIVCNTRKRGEAKLEKVGIEHAKVAPVLLNEGVYFWFTRQQKGFFSASVL